MGLLLQMARVPDSQIDLCFGYTQMAGNFALFPRTHALSYELLLAYTEDLAMNASNMETPKENKSAKGRTIKTPSKAGSIGCTSGYHSLSWHGPWD